MEKRPFFKGEVFKKEVEGIRKSLPEIEPSIEKKEEKEKETIARILERDFYPKRKEKETSLQKEEIKQEDREALSFYIGMALEKGIKEAAKEVFQTKNAWLIDAFHDKIIEEVKKEMEEVNNQ